MVKRKASISLDEWLERGEVTSVRKGHSLVGARRGEETHPNCPTAEALTKGVTGEQVPGTLVDGASHVDDESNWFWLILEQAGYERW